MDINPIGEIRNHGSHITESLTESEATEGNSGRIPIKRIVERSNLGLLLPWQLQFAMQAAESSEAKEIPSTKKISFQQLC